MTMIERGLRPADNPFSSRRIDGLEFRFQRRTWRSLIDGLEAHGCRGAIIGPHGSGKTTLLEELGDRLGGIIIRIRLNTDIDRPFATALEALSKEIGSGHTVLIDGAEQLAPLSWWRIHRRIHRAGTVVITSHQTGRLPTIHECATDVALLEELVVELAPETTGSMDLETLFYRHHGNIRSCLRELYDRCAITGGLGHGV